MAISMTCKTCVCSRPTSTNSPKATKIEPTTKSGGTMSINNKSRMVASRGLFSTVRKKLMRSKLPRKNIIIIHNNTSITSNEEDNRTSCVEVKDIAAIKDDQGKDSNQMTNPLTTSSPPPAGQKKSSTTAANNTNCAIGVVPPAAATVDGSAAPSPSAATDPAAAASLISTHFDHNSINNSDIGSEIRADKEAPTADNNNNNRINKEDKGQKKANIEAAQRQLEAAQKELEAAQRELEAATKEKASIRIQATFRGHLSRRAFWALKSLVKLQAVVRGASVRRQQRMALHCMHAMVRLQVRVRARQFLSTKSISQESN